MLEEAQLNPLLCVFWSKYIWKIFCLNRPLHPLFSRIWKLKSKCFWFGGLLILALWCLDHTASPTLASQQRGIEINPTVKTVNPKKLESIHACVFRPLLCDIYFINKHRKNGVWCPPAYTFFSAQWLACVKARGSLLNYIYRISSIKRRPWIKDALKMIHK